MTSASELYSKVCINRIKVNIMGWAYIIEKLLSFLRCIFTRSYNYYTRNNIYNYYCSTILLYYTTISSSSNSSHVYGCVITD